MRTRWPPRWQFIKKYEKIFPETGKLQGFAYKMNILLILGLQTLSL